MNDPLKIIFMGTPEFAVTSLQQLVEAGKNIVGVITAPDKPKGRGKQLGASPVKDYALSQNLNILQPTNLKDPDFQAQLKALNADLQTVVAFRMLPESVWDMPALGSVNVHASLLPDYRGAAPIHWAIINGEKETSVTTFKLQHEIDTGELIFQEKEPILPEDTVGSLYERLRIKGAELLLKTVEAIEAGKYPLIPQPQVEHPKHAPKIFKQDCEINWNRSTDELVNFVRGLNPFPTAWSTLDGQNLKIFQIAPSPRNHDGPVGSFHSDGKTYLNVKTKDGVATVEELQLAGKKRMKTKDFLRGYTWTPNH